MRKDFGAKPICYPQPVFIIATYNEDGTPNAMNAAWGGIHDTNELFMCISASHKTTENIINKKAFTVSMADAAHMAACDYVGIVSAKKEPDKFAKAGFHAVKSLNVDAPVIDELAVCIECKLKSYNETTGELVAQIVNVSIDEKILNSDGAVDFSVYEPITFDPINNTYRKIGDKAGDAFKSGNALK